MSDMQEARGGRRRNQGKLPGGGNTQTECRVRSRGSRSLQGRGRARGAIPINKGDHCSAPCWAHLLGIKC